MSNQQRTKQTSHPFWKLGFWAKARFCFWLSMKIIFRKKDEKAINELLDIHQGSPLNITSLSNPLTHNFGINDDHIFSFACQVGAFKKFTPDYSHFLKNREAKRVAGEIHTVGSVVVELDEQGLCVYWKPGKIVEDTPSSSKTEQAIVQSSILSPLPDAASFQKTGQLRSEPTKQGNDRTRNDLRQQTVTSKHGDIHG